MQAWIRRTMGAGTGVMLALAGGVVLAQNQPGSPPAGDDQGQQQQTIQLVRAQASLDTTLDAKKAKQGEPVKAKLQQNVQIPNEEMLPKNTVLEGHVDQVQPSENKGDSTVVVTFDKAVLKGGKELPIKATVLQVSEPALMQQEEAGGAPPVGGAAPMASPPAGGEGTAGGGAGANSPSAPSAPSQMDVPDANSAPQGQKQTGGVPGVMLTSDIHQHNSATFTSKGRNVHVPDGTQMQMALAVIPPGVKMQ
ncbi:MAG TPA: hypothetical protein VHZ09_05280 [Acidobacteriaceae bacterium]|jgi:hypothetical protein|nr:hypothetical protein [Acidobacteriaceae bacterium]